INHRHLNNNVQRCRFTTTTTPPKGAQDMNTNTKTQTPPPKGTGDKYLDMYSGETPKEESKVGPSTSPLDRPDFCRSLLLMRKSGTLSSVNMLAKMESEASSPVYGSIVPYSVVHGENNKLTPVILLKKDDPHLAHFKHFNKVSLVVYPLTPKERPPAVYALNRVNFGGRITRIDDEAKKAEARTSFLAKHPGGARMIDSGDYSLYQIDIADIYHYERKSTTRVNMRDFDAATVDEVCVESRDVIETLNGEHHEALRIICEQYGDIQIDEAFVYFVDSAGFNCIAKRKGTEEWLDVRVPFDQPFKTAKDCKVGLLETIKDIKLKH
ncbi:hypothetical protein SAMD00019534_097020, partial [Acytostelium subglobosum LB1]|uniref:hypothetical protein n=1 Tax=Acytostelium subglobosum LB1 TaxID=1410327 RepID=UPI0006449DC1